MSLHTCLELPNQAAISYAMYLDATNRWRTHGRTVIDEHVAVIAYPPGHPTVARKKRLWPLAGMCFFREWAGIILTHGQGR